MMLRCVFVAVVMSVAPGLSLAGDDVAFGELNVDLQGNAQYSEHNFTDLVDPYRGVDAWAEAKVTYWLDAEHTLAPYLSIIPVYASADDFWWQRSIQWGAGWQWYPIPESEAGENILRSLRFFALAAWRTYYDKPSDADSQDHDIQIGADYSYDNLFEESAVTALVFAHGSYRTTNFSLDDYRGFLCYGNIKIGRAISASPSLLLPYVVTDWTWSPSYEDRWWENFLRVGAGLRWYVSASRLQKEKNAFGRELLDRLHVFAEVIHNEAWLGDKAPDTVEETDVRIGIGFSTGGFFRNRE